MKLLLLFDIQDKPYLHRFAEIIDGHKASVYWGSIESRGQLDILAKRVGAEALMTNRKDIIGGSVANFQGSILATPLGMEMLCLPPLKQLISTTYGDWLFKRYTSKILAPHKWPEQSPFQYKVLRDNKDCEDFWNLFPQAWLCSIDIETLRPNIIRSISYTLKFHSGETRTGCFMLKSMDAVQWMRKYNAHPIAKVCQNGRYECAYFFAWNAPMVNYIGDTLNAMHSTWSELPKDLNVVSAIFNRKHQYWKDMRGEEGEDTLLEYNALDTWTTCEAFCSWLQEAPKYAWDNYILKWPQMYISHEMEMRGLKRDVLRKNRWARVYNKRLAGLSTSLAKMTATPAFNANSPKQVQALLHILTGKEWDSSKESNVLKAKDMHPLNARVLGAVLDYRSEQKLLGTYLGVGAEDKDFRGRWLYAISPTGTDTGRDASGEHAFWCGSNIQNVPGEHWQIKNTVVADAGFEIWEADFGQAEARGVAYCSGDSNLLEAVESENDFHSLNASAFFGIPYDQIYDNGHAEYWDAELGELIPAKHGKVLDKPLRNLSKRVNHGANYNMSDGVLLETMGDKHVREAQILLGLPKNLSLRDVCKFLLQRYERTYPRVKTAYYKSIISDVRKHSKLTGATGWTRYCFGKPWENKPALNAYVAHVTQSLNAMNLDEAARRIFIWRMEAGLLNTVKIMAKIHDSLLFQVPIGREDLAKEVAKRMEFPIQVTDCFGTTRSMLVPVDLKHCGHRWESFQ